ncbi:MAG: hypothetical protein MJK04_09915 [Psychrosphaera sp.]|nr:hypothetical protein [Psychrosphaera sp.]
MTDKLQNSESSLEKYKRMAAKGIAEVALIMVGILGAFAIEDWQDQKKQEKLVRVTIQITLAELSTNRCELIKAHKHQTYVRNTLKKIKPTSTDEELEQLYRSIFRIGAIRPASLLSTAWETAIATGAVRNIPLQDATLISPFYYHGKRYERQIESIIGEMTKNSFLDIPLKRQLKGMAGSNDALWWTEVRILDLYKARFGGLAKQYGFKVEDCVAGK